MQHPLDPDRVPGGSSGGSAALVAAGVVPAALGSETGGSVRQPASFCGVVGVKPTYGRVSRYGLVAFGSSLDSSRVFGRTRGRRGARCSASSAATIRSTPPRVDAPALPLPAGARADLTGVVIGLPREYFPADLDPGVRAGAATARIAARHARWAPTVREVSLPHTPYAVPTYYIVAPAEAASNLARFDGVRYGSARLEDGGDVARPVRGHARRGLRPRGARRILVGTYVLTAGYYDAYYRQGAAGARAHRRGFPQRVRRAAWTCCSRRPRRRPPSRPARRPTTRSRCT